MGRISDLVEFIEDFKELIGPDTTNRYLGLGDIATFKLYYGNQIMLSVLGNAVKFESPIEAYNQLGVDNKTNNVAFMEAFSRP